MSRRKRKSGVSALESATIASLSHDGRGVARGLGSTVFIEGALPGEEVTFRRVEHHRNYDIGVVESILQPSPHRVIPRCPHFGICGGCVLQHLDPTAQVAHKQQQLVDNLLRIGKVEIERLAEPLLGPQWGYRHKARLGVRYVRKRGEVLIGFRERRSNFLTLTRECPVLHSSVGERINDLTQLIDSLDGREAIAQIEMAADEQQTALALRNLAPLSLADRHRLTEFAMQYHLAILEQPGNQGTIAPIWPTSVDLAYLLPDYQLRLAFQAGDFTQVNPAINRAMVAQAMAWLEPQAGETIVDLFCGIGNFTLPIARLGATVVGVEGSRDLVDRATANGAANQLDQATFHVADLSSDVTQAAWWPSQINKVVLDPSRDGASGVIPAILQRRPQRILYISCNPATLARDAGLLAAGGYQLRRGGIMDMFPHTAHIESMALFEPERSR
jgi:23S rRNA (uracil1939-C5)-methyltransferase